MKLILGILAGSKEAPRPAPRWVLASLQSAEVNQGDAAGKRDFQQGFQITFRAERGRADRQDYALLDSTLLAPGNRVILTVTLNATPRVLIDGIIAHRQLLPDSSLLIMGKDISVLMDLEEKDVSHAGLKDAQRVRFILGKYAQYGITPKVVTPDKDWTPAANEGTPKQLATDRQYLQDLAAAHGYIFRIKPGPTPGRNVAYWGPLEYSDSPQRALTTNVGPASNVESLNFAENALAPTQVFGSVTDANASQATAIDVEKSDAATALSRSQRLGSGGAFVRKLRLVYSGPSVTEAQARAQAIADRSTEEVVRATGTLDAFRYGALLVAPGRAEVRGAGFAYDGDYYVKQVTHEISRQAYRQRFTLTREGTGSLVQRVKV